MHGCRVPAVGAQCPDRHDQHKLTGEYGAGGADVTGLNSALVRRPRGIRLNGDSGTFPLRDHHEHATLPVAISNFILAISSRSARGDSGSGRGTGAGGRCRPASARNPRTPATLGISGISDSPGICSGAGTSRSSGSSCPRRTYGGSCAPDTSRACNTSRVVGGSHTYGSPPACFRSVAPSAPDSPGAAPDLEP
jgi:hypothetical protein